MSFDDREHGKKPAAPAELARALELLRNITDRFERCCIASGSDPVYAAEACKDARAFLAQKEKEPRADVAPSPDRR